MDARELLARVFWAAKQPQTGPYESPASESRSVCCCLVGGMQRLVMLRGVSGSPMPQPQSSCEDDPSGPSSSRPCLHGGDDQDGSIHIIVLCPGLNSPSEAPFQPGAPTKPSFLPFLLDPNP